MHEPLRSALRVVARLAPFVGAVFALAATLAACGGDQPDAAVKQGAISLQAAMGSASRGIDNVRPTRSSLDNLAATLRDASDQTGDVIAVLTAKAGDKPAAALLVAAQKQRQFLQNAQSAASDHSRTAALASVATARTLGVAASDAYAAASRDFPAFAGIVPAAATFATGRLRDAIVAGVGTSSTTKKPTTGTTQGGTTQGGKATGMTDCGGGLSVNAATTCPFARNVAQAYSDSGGADVIDVYSPVTKQTYTMTCTGAMPTVCEGGNGARVEIR